MYDYVRPTVLPYKDQISAISRRGIQDNLSNLNFGKKHPIFWPFPGKGLEITPSNLKFDMEHPWARGLRFKKRQIEGPCEDHVLAIKGHIFAISRKGN